MGEIGRMSDRFWVTHCDFVSYLQPLGKHMGDALTDCSDFAPQVWQLLKQCAVA